MKIAICGKGGCGKRGCGKSTITTLLAKALASKNKEVLIIDSDESNYGLHTQLGMEMPKGFTGYFGGKEKVMNDMMLSKFKHSAFLFYNKQGYELNENRSAATKLLQILFL